MTAQLLIDKTIKKIEFLLLCIGISVRSEKETRYRTIMRRILYMFNRVCVFCDLGGTILWFLDGIANSKDILELTYVAPCIVMASLAEAKSIIMFASEKKVCKLYEILRKLESSGRLRSNSSEAKEMIENEHKFVNKVITVVYAINVAVGIGFALSPLALVILKYVKTNEVETVLPFPIIHPFDPYDVKVWPFIYIRQVWSEIIVILEVCTVDNVFFTFCTYLRIQFQLLTHEIKRGIPYRDETTGLDDSDELKNKYIELIKWHHELIDSANLIEIVYTKSTLFNFVSSSILICLCGFNATVMDDAFYVYTFISFLFMSLLQIFFLCFFGDLLMSSTMEVSDAAYHCKWYLADKSFRKYVLIVQTRAQTPCQLTAMNFADVNRRSFMKILSTSWSYFALLQTIYSTPKQ